MPTTCFLKIPIQFSLKMITVMSVETLKNFQHSTRLIHKSRNCDINFGFNTGTGVRTYINKLQYLFYILIIM